MSLAHISILLGGSLLALFAGGLIAPARARAAAEAFPRHRGAGWVLTAIAIAWVTYLLYKTNWHPMIAAYKPSLVILSPLCFWLIGTYLDELLAPRALGGLLILVPALLLDAARPHESNLRYLPLVLAYALALQGTFLVITPYRFRSQLAYWLASESRTRALGALGVGLGVVFVVLGLTAY